MPQKMLIIVGDGGESYETLYANHRLMEEGYIPVVASPSKRPLNLVIHDFEPGWDTYVERIGYRWNADIAFADVDTQDYVAVIIIGGRSPEYLRNDSRVLDIVREFAAAGKGIFALCHGVQIVAAAGLAKGRNVTCYEHTRWEAEVSGGKYVDRECVRDGNMITARTWQDHPAFYREVFAWLRQRSGTSSPSARAVAAAAVD
jgi:protease I